MRGVVNVMLVSVTLVAMMIFAPAAIEPIGETVIDIGSLSEAQEQNVTAFYDAIFVRIPLVAFMGVFAFGVAWYIREQITVTQQ